LRVLLVDELRSGGVPAALAIPRHLSPTVGGGYAAGSRLGSPVEGVHCECLVEPVDMRCSTSDLAIGSQWRSAPSAAVKATSRFGAGYGVVEAL
jgi:hypothetical protein